MAPKEKKAKSPSAPFDPNAAQERPVLVTTEHRGVFQGDLVSYDASTRTATIKQARNCISWRGIKGFIALAASGPNSNCRIGSAAPSLIIEKVTSIAECTQEAVAAWQHEPW